MRLFRYLDRAGVVRLGRVDGAEQRWEVEGALMGVWRDVGRPAEVAQWLAPLEPAAILCIGLNYRDHAAETGQALPERPVLFMKNPGAVVGHEGGIVLAPGFVARPEVDYEGELAVIIGRAARDVTVAGALAHVFGYTVANDVSARRVQRDGGGGQWVRGKSFDTFCPLGPWMVTADEVGDPQALRLCTRLNGETMQEGSTANMVFSVAELIADLSQGMTLLPGTVILTGTPAGVGFVRTPRVFLRPGDRVEVSIEGVGLLANDVVAA